MDKTMKFVFGILFPIIGLVMCIVGARTLYIDMVSTGWPTTDGTVIGTDISTSTGTRSGSSTTYTPQVKYEYRVSGLRYSNDKVFSTSRSTSDIDFAVEIVDKYAVGSTVTVYYNASDPQLAVLEPGLTWWSFIPLLIGFGLIVTGMAYRRFPVSHAHHAHPVTPTDR